MLRFLVLPPDFSTLNWKSVLVFQLDQFCEMLSGSDHKHCGLPLINKPGANVWLKSLNESEEIEALHRQWKMLALKWRSALKNCSTQLTRMFKQMSLNISELLGALYLLSPWIFCHTLSFIVHFIVLAVWWGLLFSLLMASYSIGQLIFFSSQCCKVSRPRVSLAIRAISAKVTLLGGPLTSWSQKAGGQRFFTVFLSSLPQAHLSFLDYKFVSGLISVCCKLIAVELLSKCLYIWGTEPKICVKGLIDLLCPMFI